MTVVTFGSFPNGGLSEFSDTTQNGYSPYLTVLPSDWVAGKYKARFSLNNAFPPPFRPDSHMRMHVLGNSTISASFLQQGITFYKCHSIRWTSGAPLYIFDGEEIHASGPYALANGPAPAGWSTISPNGKWSFFVNGASNPNDSGFISHQYGDATLANDGSTRFSTGWLGAPSNVVTNQWMHIFMRYLFHSTTGSFELWAAPHGSQMVNVVPRVTIPTCYAPPIGHYPMLSLYYPNAGGEHTIEYAAGAYGSDEAELRAFQTANIGYSPWGGGGGGGGAAVSRLTLNPAVVDHTLPDKFWGIGHSPYASNNDQPVAAYKTLVNALGMEVFRAHSWGDGTAASQSQTLALKAMATDYQTGTPGMKTILQLNAKTAATNTNPTTNFPNDIKTPGTDGSPSDMAATLASWQSAGINVGWLEPYNEPYNNFVGGVGDNWKDSTSGYSGSSPTDQAGNACRDWAAIYQKTIYQLAKAAGASVPIAGCVIAGAARDYITGEVLRWCEPNVYIPSTPRSDTNYSFFDTFSCHAYLSAPGTQSDLNSLFYTGAPDNDDRSATTAFSNNFRTLLDSKGKQTADMIFTECAIFEGGSVGGLTDAAYAIMFARNSGRWNVGCFIYHSLDTTNVDHVINDNGHTHATYQRTMRYRVMEQLVSPFIRLYKKQLFSDLTLSWTAVPGLSPGGAKPNSVTRMQIAAGLNSASTTIGVLVANIDLATAETLTIDLPSGVTMTAAASYTKMPAGVTYSLGTDVASLTTATVAGTFSGSTTLSQSVGAGEACLITIPITGAPTGGSPYDVQPANWLGGTYAITGTTQHGSQVDKQRCYKVVVATAGTVTNIGHFREPQALAGSETIKLAVWPDNGSGTDPGSGAILGQTAEISFTSSSIPGRYSTPVVTPFAVTAGQVVWVGEINGGVGNIAYVRKNTVTNAFRLMDRTYASGPTTWNTAIDTAYDLDMTIWLEGTPALAPSLISVPVVSGQLVVGQTLSVTTGTWMNAPTSFTYLWWRFLTASSTFQAIPTATQASYTLQGADVGNEMMCQVTAINAAGQNTVSSLNTGVVSAQAPSVAGRTISSGHNLTTTRRVDSGRRAAEGGGG